MTTTAEPLLHTERLSIRRFAPDDVDWWVDLYADPDVARHLGGVKTRAQASDLLRLRAFEYYDAHPGLGMWLTLERATGNRVGFHLLNNIQGETIIQVGYGLAPGVWGRGYATEMARALLHYGFARLQLPVIAGMTTMANGASQRVLAKIGLERRGERAFPHPAYASAGAMAWFEGERDRWLAAYAASSADSVTRLTQAPSHRSSADP